jgi:hypothetical protein
VTALGAVDIRSPGLRIFWEMIEILFTVVGFYSIGNDKVQFVPYSVGKFQP